MNLLSKFFTACSFAAVVLAQHSGGGAECDDPFRPLLSVPDFNADGIVDAEDQRMVASAVQTGNSGVGYLALYDVNANRRVNPSDENAVDEAFGQASTLLDQEAARAFLMAQHLRGEKTEQQWRASGFVPINVPLEGHGTHYFSPEGVAAVTGTRAVNFTEIQGINIGDTGDIEALFFGSPALPLFSIDGQLTPLDYQTCQPYRGDQGCQWISHAPVRFYQGPNHPPKITQDDCEQWHAHAGLCLWQDEDGVQHLDQHLSFLECVTTPGSVNDPSWALYPWNLPPRLYLNFWMVHYWNYNPNPSGLFANTHPCVTPGGVSEESLNDRALSYGREIPHFFHMLHNQELAPGCGPISEDDDAQH